MKKDMRFKISKEKLEELYRKECKSSKEIAKLFATTHSTILRYLEKYEIKKRPKGGRVKFNFLRNTIFNLYWKNGLSTRKIAKMFGCSDTTILDFMKKNNIPRRRCGAQPKVNVSKEQLNELYWDQKKSTLDIAKILGIDRVTAFYYLKKFGLPLRERIEAVSEGAHRKLSIHARKPFSNHPLEKQYLLGISEDFSVSRASKWLIKVALSTTHPSMTKLFKECFGRYGPIWTYPVKTKTGEYCWRLTCTLDESFSFLLKQNRTFDFSSFTQEEFFSRLAGIIDAEGYIGIGKTNKKYISRRIFIGSENEKMIKEINKKLKELGFISRIYKLKTKFEESKIANLRVKYNDELWALLIMRKNDLAKLTGKLPLRNQEKCTLLSLLRKNLQYKFWDEIKDEVEKFKNKIKVEVNLSKKRAELDFNHSF